MEIEASWGINRERKKDLHESASTRSKLCHTLIINSLPINIVTVLSFKFWFYEVKSIQIVNIILKYNDIQ